MATLVPKQIAGPFEIITAGTADFTWAACSTDTDTFPCTGKEIIIVRNSNTGSTAYTFTVTSVVDEKNRERTEAYTLQAGDYAVFGMGLTTKQGWRNGTNIIIDVSNAEVLVAILKLPLDTLR
jgi:hypothetical protein